ncbi:MAG TPA: protease modulator HflC [Planctomycetota bacterium]|nr:protease modulator HflC [Planctomycetota bacterium]
MRITTILIALLALFLLLVFSGAFYTVRETDTVIVTQFGRPVGDPISEPGLHWKTPFVQDVTRLDKRVLEFDGMATEMPTKDKTYIEVDAFGRWRIGDAARFYVALKDERSAQSRLEDIIGSEVRTAVASHELIEIIRSDKSRVLPPDLEKQISLTSVLPNAKRGRLEIQKDILAAAAPKLAPLGIELLDVRIKRVNYNSEVLTRIYQRMISERQQIAQRFRSEGEGEAARILGKKEKDLREIESVAYKQVQQNRGEADAEATRIYAEAYDQSPEAREFYTFVKTMDTYKAVLGSGTNLVLSTDSDLFRLFKQTGR